MKARTKSRLLFGVLTLSAGPLVRAQAVSAVSITSPTAVSFGQNLQIPLGDGTLHYDLTASAIAEYGAGVTGGSGWDSILNAGGDFSYTAKSIAHPFNLLYSGGYFWTSIPGVPSTTYQTLVVSQGLVKKNWSAAVSNAFSYLPLSPTMGISGIPGLGDLGLQTGQASAGPAPTFLTNYSTILIDAVTADLNRALNHNTYLNTNGSWATMRYLSDSGLDNTSITAAAGINRRLNARTTVGVQYAYSDFTYPAFSAFNFTTQGVNLLFTRQWSRPLTINISIGPQWISGGSSFPTQLQWSANIGATYVRRFSSASLAYTRGSMSGVGVLPGAFEDSVQASWQRTYGRNWMTAFTATYMRATGLNGIPSAYSTPQAAAFQGSGAIDSEYAGAQVTRNLGHSFSTYASYTIQDQSAAQSLPTQNAFSGLGQILGVGITFSPHSTHLGQL